MHQEQLQVDDAAPAAAAATVAVPEDGREYRVVLGRSLIGGGGGVSAVAHPMAPSPESSNGGSALMRALRGRRVDPSSAADASEGARAATAVPCESTPDEVFVSFRYEFQPASVDTSTPGLVTVDDSSGLQVLRGHSSGTPGGILFKGKAVENKEIDCLLLFDGDSFRLEKCPFSYTQLRHVRAPSSASASASTAASATRRHAAKAPAPAPAGSDGDLVGAAVATESTELGDVAEADGEPSTPTGGPTAARAAASARGRGRGRGRGGRGGRGRGRGKAAAAAGSSGAKVARGAKAAVVRIQQAASATTAAAVGGAAGAAPSSGGKM